MNKFGKVSIITAGLVLPLTLLISAVVAWYLKFNNPDNVDITAALAYLRPTLLTAITCFTAFWLLSLISGIVGLKKDHSDEYSKIGLILLILITVVSLCAGITTKKTSDAESSYQAQSARRYQNQ